MGTETARAILTPCIKVMTAPRSSFTPSSPPALFQVGFRSISLSYIVAAQYRYGSTADNEALRVKLAQNLTDAGFAPYLTVYGKTGASSTTPDVGALVSYRTSDNSILVIFHGSLFTNPLDLINAQTDWGTDFNYHVVTASAAGLTDIASDVKMHAGVTGNYKSIQAALNKQISTILNTKFTSKSPVWVYVTGHSLGGATCVLAGAGIRAYLNNNQRADVNVGVVAMSGMPIFSGQTAQTWVSSSIGHCNIIRVDVKGDPVTVLPPLTQYKHVGAHFLDDTDNVLNKQIALYGALYVLNPGTALAYHYCGFNPAGFYDPEIVMKHSEFTYRRQYALNNDYGTRYAMNTPV
jgi:hypothetical protein